jgi:hypothetical protein
MIPFANDLSMYHALDDNGDSSSITSTKQINQ